MGKLRPPLKLKSDPKAGPDFVAPPSALTPDSRFVLAAIVYSTQVRATSEICAMFLQVVREGAGATPSLVLCTEKGGRRAGGIDGIRE